MNYILETLSPLHIGTLEKYMSFDFYFDNNNKTVSFIDQNLLIKAPDHILDYYFKEINEGNFRWSNLQRYYKNFDPRRYSKYQLKTYNSFIRSREIQAFIKTCGFPYIPGSSIKGALAVQLLKKSWNKAKKNYCNEIDTKKNELETKKSKPEDKKRKLEDKDLRSLASRADEITFGKPTQSPFKFLMLGDSNNILYENMEVAEYKFLNICNNQPRWIKFGRERMNIDFYNEATCSYVEAVSPNTVISGSFKLDEKLNNKYLTEEGKIKFIEIFNNAAEGIRNVIREYIQTEIDFYKNYGPKELEEFYLRLLAKNNQLKPNEVILQIGFGTGFKAKSVLPMMDKTYTMKLKDLGYRIKAPELYPKTRKIVFRNGKPFAPFGWVKMTLPIGE